MHLASQPLVLGPSRPALGKILLFGCSQASWSETKLEPQTGCAGKETLQPYRPLGLKRIGEARFYFNVFRKGHNLVKCFGPVCNLFLQNHLFAFSS